MSGPIRAMEAEMAQLRDHTIAVRATTGQHLAIRYDAQANNIVFIEDDWFAEGFRSGTVPPREQFRSGPAVAKIIRLRPRRRAA